MYYLLILILNVFNTYANDQPTVKINRLLGSPELTVVRNGSKTHALLVEHNDNTLGGSLPKLFHWLHDTNYLTDVPLGISADFVITQEGEEVVIKSEVKETVERGSIPWFTADNDDCSKCFHISTLLRGDQKRTITTKCTTRKPVSID